VLGLAEVMNHPVSFIFEETVEHYFEVLASYTVDTAGEAAGA
jgi:hypothetical protein